MTDTETMTLSEISDQLELLRRYRQRVSHCEHALRWIDELAQCLSSAKKIDCTFIFRRSHTKPGQNDRIQEIALPPDTQAVALLLAKEHWQRLIPPLEAWLDARKIEHVESAKAD